MKALSNFVYIIHTLMALVLKRQIKGHNFNPVVIATAKNHETFLI